MVDLERALKDPSSVYRTPRDVVADKHLDRETKLMILRQWELDARELAVAEEENMQGNGPSMLSRVLRSIDLLS
jgi:hypothetical protein